MIIRSMHEIVSDPVMVLEIYEEFRTGKRPDLPPKFFCGSEGLCRAVVIVIHICDRREIDVGDIDVEVAEEMGLGPIIDRFENLDTMLALYGEIIG
jgi:hypothetical protein